MSRLHRNLLAFAFGFALMLLWASSYADNCTDVTWTPSTFDTLGKIMTDRTGYKVYYGTTPTLTTSVTTSVNATLQTLCGLQPVKYYIAVSTLRASDGEGAMSNLASATPTATPQVFSTIDTNVYKQTQGNNGFTMVLVGAIPLKFPCSTAHLVDGYSLLPSRDDPAINYKTAIKNCISCKPQSVYAKCALQ